MQSRRLRMSGAVACMTAMFAWSAPAAEPADTDANADAVSTGEVSDQAEFVELFAEPPVRVKAGAKIVRMVTTSGPEGQTQVQEGTVSAGLMDCLDDPDSIYCNTGGAFIFGNSGSAFAARFSDDIVATGGAGCLLDRYVIRVTGDKKQDGTGVGAYTVNYALYESCPGANLNPLIIPGTQGSMQIGAELAGDIIEIEHHVASGLPLKASQMYVGISFDRDLCGGVVGSPAVKGFSADQLDIPGAACNAWLGGFPGAPHASLYTEIYTSGACETSFMSYRNAAHAELAVQENELVRLADDFILAEDCRLVAYEVAFKPAVIEVDLRRGPALGGENGPIISGTQAQFAPCATCGVQVGHVDVDPPIQLFAGDVHWLTFLSLQAGRGPILTCRPPFVGDTANQYLAWNSSTNQWDVRPGDNRCWFGFDVTFYCEGSPPPGACCDMAIKECVDGPNDGAACDINAQCLPGTCESVCREVSRLNCTGAALNAPTLWRENGTCGPVCTSGGAVGEHCSTNAECNVCVEGPRDGEVCCPDGNCAEVCAARTQISCNNNTDCRVCVGGDLGGFPCPSGNDIDCFPGGTCDTTDTCEPRCIGGSLDGLECCPFGECPEGACEGAFCVGGSNSGAPCTREVDCPGGSCEGGPFARSCGSSACCKPNGSFCVGGLANDDPCQFDEDCPGGNCVEVGAIGVCDNLTENECNAVPPQGLPRRFQVGLGCGIGGQECPLSACLTRAGDCTTERDAFCRGGQLDEEPCNILAFPSECATNASVGNYCGGNCVGGDNDGELCDPLGFYNVQRCEGGTNNLNTCTGPNDCPGGICIRRCPNGNCTGGGICREAECRGRTGCQDEFCCTDVCLSPGNFSCCTLHWDSICAQQALATCERQLPGNDECFHPDIAKGALLVTVPDTVEGDSIRATPETAAAPGAGLEPGFCCHAESPGTGGVGTLWYKFIATDTSVEVNTCGSVSRNRDGISYRAEDSLIAIYAPSEPRRGVCADQATVCDVIDQDCADGSDCVFDERTACETLTPIACNDNDGTCGDNESGRAGVCASGLIPGQTYYIQVAGKSNAVEAGDIVRGNGVWRINVSSPCQTDRPIMGNDPCSDAYVVEGGDESVLTIPFDLSGDTVGQCLGGSGDGDLCVISQNTCPDAAPCVLQAAATFDCPGPPISCDFGTIRNDIWYEWTAPKNGEAVFSTCGEQGDQDTPDTGLVLYDCFDGTPGSDVCSCPADDRCIAVCSWITPSPCLGGSHIEYPVEEGRCYQLRLGGNFGEEPAGDLKISVGSFCGNDNYDPNPIFGPDRCIGGANDSLECTSDADCPNGICGEECDGGDGCGSDCQCLPGWGPTPIPSRNCMVVDLCAALSSSVPACDGVMPRVAGGVIILDFGAGPAPATTAIQVQELADGGLFGPNVTSEFDINAVGNVITLTNTGTPLANGGWYEVSADGCDFSLQFVVIYGDANLDGTTNAFDVNDIWANRGTPSGPADPFDTNGDGTINAFDVNDAWANRNSTDPGKPGGHTCP